MSSVWSEGCCEDGGHWGEGRGGECYKLVEKEEELRRGGRMR